jgi:tripeptide aminopeptidase
MYSTLERFLSYVTYDTQSVDRAETVPSSPGQHVLAKVLGEELRALGLKDVEVTEHAYVTATLPSNIKDPAKKKKVPAIGFVGHMDTATEVTGKNVKPRVVKNY